MYILYRKLGIHVLCFLLYAVSFETDQVKIFLDPSAAKGFVGIDAIKLTGKVVPQGEHMLKIKAIELYTMGVILLFDQYWSNSKMTSILSNLTTCVILHTGESENTQLIGMIYQ